MSQKNQIAIVIPDAELQNINSLIAQLKAALAAYVHKLTNDQIGALLKMGDKTVNFVSKVKDYTETNPKFVPNFMNVEDFIIDVNAVNKLSPVAKNIKQIDADLSDTIILAGNGFPYILNNFYYISIKNASL
jgi:hypothetical protein